MSSDDRNTISSYQSFLRLVFATPPAAQPTTTSAEPPSSSMGPTSGSNRPKTSPTSPRSAQGGHLSRQSSASSAGGQNPTQQSPGGQSNRSLADILTDRSDSLALSLFSGLVDASDGLSSQQKKDLKWIKVEPGESPKSPKSPTRK
jgi:hypothetical protein